MLQLLGPLGFLLGGDESLGQKEEGAVSNCLVRYWLKLELHQPLLFFFFFAPTGNRTSNHLWLLKPHGLKTNPMIIIEQQHSWSKTSSGMFVCIGLKKKYPYLEQDWHMKDQCFHLSSIYYVPGSWPNAFYVFCPYFLPQTCKKYYIPVLQMRKLELRKVKWLAQNHMASKWLCQVASTVCSSFKPFHRTWIHWHFILRSVFQWEILFP